MTATPKQFLALAEELAQRERDEAALRTAISRAYYAAYHACEPLAETLPEAPLPPGKPYGVHERRILRFTKTPLDSVDAPARPWQEAVRDLGNKLSAVKQIRTRADYKLTETVQKQDWMDASRLARSIFLLLKTLPPPPAGPST